MGNYMDHIYSSELYFIELSITSFKNYITIVEANLQLQHKAVLEKYHQITRKLQDDDYTINDVEIEFYSAQKALREVEVEFIQRFRYSIIIQLYSFLESELLNFCDIHHELHVKEFKVSDLKGNNDLDKIKKYLTNSADKKIGENVLWPFINDLRKLRNVIVHSNGLIMKGDNDFNALQKFSKNNFKIHGSDEYFHIRLNNTEFLNLCLDKIQVFLLSIIDE